MILPYLKSFLLPIPSRRMTFTTFLLSPSLSHIFRLTGVSSVTPSLPPLSCPPKFAFETHNTPFLPIFVFALGISNRPFLQFLSSLTKAPEFSSTSSLLITLTSHETPTTTLSLDIRPLKIVPFKRPIILVITQRRTVPLKSCSPSPVSNPFLVTFAPDDITVILLKLFMPTVSSTLIFENFKMYLNCIGGSL